MEVLMRGVPGHRRATVCVSIRGWVLGDDWGKQRCQKRPLPWGSGCGEKISFYPPSLRGQAGVRTRLPATQSVIWTCCLSWELEKQAERQAVLQHNKTPILLAALLHSLREALSPSPPTPWLHLHAPPQPSDAGLCHPNFSDLDFPTHYRNPLPNRSFGVSHKHLKIHSFQARRAWRAPTPSQDHFADVETGVESEAICSRSQGTDYNASLLDHCRN